MAVRQQNDLRLFLDITPDPRHLSTSCSPSYTALIPPGSIILSLKHFHIVKQRIIGVGKRAHAVNIWMFYKEINPGRIELMMPKLTFTRSKTQNGDIICSQVDMNEELHDFEMQGCTRSTTSPALCLESSQDEVRGDRRRAPGVQHEAELYCDQEASHLQAPIGVPDKDSATYRFAMIQHATFK
ncbi:hypothetical protein NUW54_g4726 [Trametes sanguinea]|uniref:Uncharacterized protein n=1 Tax=Trametes sanguinea TaxID=158606 RepID=A0ACC1Q0K6_9APHY|nr:hypothetical protein NUW54_g4726 [Trametes sanguinea]